MWLFESAENDPRSPAQEADPKEVAGGWDRTRAAADGYADVV